MFKKLASFILLCFIILVSIPSQNINAQEELVITSPSVVLMESSTKKILYEKNSNEVRATASITKVMTLLLTMEAIEDGILKLDDTLTASAHAASMGGSDIWLESGETMTVDDLIKSVVVMSANDAAVVLAEAIAGSEESFVNMMNEKASELGMNNTVFKNCNGLDEEGHVSSAYDVALMSSALIEYEEIQEYTLTWIDYIRNGQTQLVNTNKLIRTFNGITGLKTGTTSQAGSCVTATATRDSMTLIAVVLGAPSSDIRFEDAETLLNYGFAKYKITEPLISIPPVAQVTQGMQDYVNIEITGDISVLTETSQAGDIGYETYINEELTAPISSGQIVGSVKILNGTEVLKELDIITTEDVESMSFSKVFIYFLSKFSL